MDNDDDFLASIEEDNASTTVAETPKPEAVEAPKPQETTAKVETPDEANVLVLGIIVICIAG